MFSSCNFLLVCLLQYTLKEAWMIKVFNSNVLTLLFYMVYLCLILDLRRGNNNYSYRYFELQQQSFIRQISFIIYERLYHTSFKLNIVSFPNALHSGPPMTPLRGSQWPQNPSCILFPNSGKTQNFFPSWLTLCCTLPR